MSSVYASMLVLIQTASQFSILGHEEFPLLFLFDFSFEATPSNVQSLVLIMLRGPHVVLRIEPETAICQARALIPGPS